MEVYKGLFTYVIKFNVMSPECDFFFIFFPFFLRQVPIPNKGTTYWCQMFKIPAFQEKHHVIKVCDFHVGQISLMLMKKIFFLKIKIAKIYRNDFYVYGSS